MQRANPVAGESAASSNKVAYYLQLFCRYFIATGLLFYAAGKIFETQFYVNPSRLDMPFRFMSGFELLWTFYGYSYLYGLFLAGAQITVSFLLFFRKTVRLGLLIFFPIMGNILLIDIFYSIPALPAVLPLLLAGTYLFIYDIKNFLAYAFGTPFVRTAQPRLASRVRWTKYAFIPIILVVAMGVTFFSRQATLYETPLTGIWEFQETREFGGSDTEMRRLYFDLGSQCAMMSEPSLAPDLFAQCEVDRRDKKVNLRTFPGNPQEVDFEGDYTLNEDGDRLTLASSDSPETYELERIPTNHSISDRLNVGEQAIPRR